MAVMTIPMKIAPGTRRTMKIAVMIRPPSVNSTLGLVKSPNLIKFVESSTTTPAIRNPKNEINKPIPAVIANFKLFGIAVINLERRGVKDKIMNKIPAINTEAKAVV